MSTIGIGRRWIGRAAPLTRALTGVAVVGLLAAVLAVPAPPVGAAAGVTISAEGGAAELDPDGTTRIHVSGQGFQVVPGGFGGVYVLFGWVDDPAGGGWRPSRGGVTGDDYLYVPDSESRDNQGYQRFVAFPGSETASSANGGVLADDGSWSLTMNVPGSRFDAVDRSGATRSVDCTKVTCGVITIGAHAVVNANNETFTPVRFATGGGAAPGGTAGAGGGSGGQAAETGEGAGREGSAGAAGEGSDPAADPAGTPATVGVDRSTVMVGRVLTFVGQGFKPGEQVVATLDDGVAAVGPLVAGRDGEVAGVLQLPAGIKVGTHTLRLAGAASGQSPEVELTVRADPVAVEAAEAAAAASKATSPATWAYVVVGVAALVFLALVVSSLAAAVRRRREARRATRSPGAKAEVEAGGDGGDGGVEAGVVDVTVEGLGVTVAGGASGEAEPGAGAVGSTARPEVRA